ncbi:DNA-directed RNA polymerase V subunit 5C [Raphanus sativus]|uniref:DNA-directed RNA polymerase V subunit 5C n=1 Tax=Raphanus sativus TaxID=3726 RepID=A0A6J0LT75_RAPSA|nr:DNA-directed RNA polymerase V subunit 5C [Raphanus sativus]KAJ4867185.1 DNA-directed RNA polymerase V subunit 5C [Raphanus sativus]
MEEVMAVQWSSENGVSTFDDGTHSHCIAKTEDKGGDESKRFYLARTTALEMLRDRGYQVSDAELSLSLSEFRSGFGEKPDLERLRICVPLRSNPMKKILVVFMGIEPVTVKSVRAIHSQVSGTVGLHGLILVLQGKMNHFARKELATFPCTVETFPIGDLLVNITKHTGQPKIEVLTKEEKEKLMSEHALEDKQLPSLKEKDSFVRYHGLKKGQVVKITYSKEPVGYFVTYRCIF